MEVCVATTWEHWPWHWTSRFQSSFLVWTLLITLWSTRSNVLVFNDCVDHCDVGKSRCFLDLSGHSLDGDVSVQGFVRWWYAVFLNSGLNVVHYEFFFVENQSRVSVDKHFKHDDLLTGDTTRHIVCIFRKWVCGGVLKLRKLWLWKQVMAGKFHKIWVFPCVCEIDIFRQHRLTTEVAHAFRDVVFNWCEVPPKPCFGSECARKSSDRKFNKFFF